MPKIVEKTTSDFRFVWNNEDGLDIVEAYFLAQSSCEGNLNYYPYVSRGDPL